MTSHIKLYGEKEKRFEAIKSDLEDELGYAPTNPEVLGILMAGYGSDERDTRSLLLP